MKKSDGSYPAMPGFGSLFEHPPVPGMPSELTANDDEADDETSDCPAVQGTSSQLSTSINVTVQPYDVYSRPLELDPTNNMPLSNPDNVARNSLPSKEQIISLPTERVSSTIPKGGTDGETWTYPSPQMFWNSLARKGKLGSTKEEDMEVVVAIHNDMNEGTWEKILEWEEVIGEEGPPKLLKFTGRPFDLSPKAKIKHYLLGHPFPFDRHDWTILRPSGRQVRYVIDYYHDTAAENDSTTNRLLVDVRPALDRPSELWGRIMRMPLAMRGCSSILDCVLHLGKGKGKKSEFQPLPLRPSRTLKLSMDDSKKTWAGIQRDAKQILEDGKKAAATASDEPPITELEATKIAESYTTIMTQCEHAKSQLDNCDNDATCRKTFMGMTACAGKVLCPLQYESFVDALREVTEGKEIDEVTNSKINIAFETLSECVSENDAKASLAKNHYPKVMQELISSH